MLGIGFTHGQCICAQNGLKRRRQAKTAQQHVRQCGGLIGAYAQMGAARGKALKGGNNAGINRAENIDMVCIIFQQSGIERIHIVLRPRRAQSLKR